MENIKEIIRLALNEDSARHDITSQAIFSGVKFLTADVVVKSDGVVCGIEVVKEVFKMLDTKCCVKAFASDGAEVSKGKVVARVAGPAKAILAGERTALNFIAHLSGIATLTKKYVDMIKGTKSKIFDTRKTTPGLRALEKYAVVCGGGCNHRMNLSEMALVKDNHVGAVKNIGEAVKKIRKYRSSVKIEVECDTLAQVSEALEAGADIIMFDNMSAKMAGKAAKIVNKFCKRVRGKLPELEISGGINLSTVAKYARLGSFRISVGAITQSAPALDISLDIK